MAVIGRLRVAEAAWPLLKYLLDGYGGGLQAHLRRHDVSQETFMESLLQAEMSTARNSRSLVTSLLMVQDFEAFAQMMAQRALEKDL